MPASCRVRRGATFSSPYAPLLDGAEKQQTEENGTSPNPDEDGARLPTVTSLQRGSKSIARRGSDTANRPRSRTLASLFGEPSPPTHPRETSSFSGPTQPRSTEGGDTLRRPTHGLVTGHLVSRRSQLPLRASDPLESPRPSEVAAHGSQVDVLIPNESQPGVVGSALSYSLDDQTENMHHEDDIVEHLEVIDPQIAAVSHLSNAANSILIPPMSLYSRRPVIHLPRRQALRPEDLVEKGDQGHKDDLDRHVEHVLSRRDKIRRTVAGIWSFLKTPMGIIAAFYGFCVVFWGAAIVFFLANFVPTSSKDRQGFWVEVSSQIENALFTVTGIGLLPWRIVDTYRILRIWNLKRISTRLRKKAGLPELYDEDDLPDPQYDPNFVHVLTDKQQKALHHQQKEFAKSQTWYRPHGTQTHRAFPIETALLICLFIDGNSFFQAILCGCMWSLNRFQRPAWTTGTLIPASFMCGIVSAILIWKGGQKTKRTKEVEERLRAALEVEHRTGVPAAIAAVASHPSNNLQIADFSAPAGTKPESPTIEEKMMIPEGVEPSEHTHNTSATSIPEPASSNARTVTEPSR